MRDLSSLTCMVTLDPAVERNRSVTFNFVTEIFFMTQVGAISAVL